MTDPLAELARRFVDWPDPGEVVAARTLDVAGVLAVGARTSEGAAVARFDGADGWGGGVLDQVLRRVATARLTELDDIDRRSCTTPGSVVVPVALTVGAALGVGPETFRRAVTVGYEAMTRLGAAIDGAHVVYRGVWPTYFCAPFTAAAVVASLLELDTGQTANALGFGLTRATGLTSGTAGAPLARWLTVGDAARAGCLGALAARDGFVADVDVDRVAAGAGVELDVAVLLADRAAAIGSVSMKPFPTAKQSLAPTEAALRLRTRVDVGGIQAIRVFVPQAYAHMIARPPLATSRLSRISSTPWNVALALARPEALGDVERAVSVDDVELASLAALVEVVPDHELSRLYPDRWPARLELQTTGGTVGETVVDASGDPGLGVDPLDVVEEKWRTRSDLGSAVEELARVAAVDAGALRQLDEALRSLT